MKTEFENPDELRKYTAPHEEIDPNMADLVRALNEAMCVMLDDCGRDSDPLHYQKDRYDWWVHLQFAPDSSGWDALAFLTYAVIEAQYSDDILLRPSYNRRDGLYFVLEGKNANPDKFAKSLQARLNILGDNGKPAEDIYSV